MNENESLAGLYAKVYAAAIATDRRDPAAIARAAVRDFDGLMRECSLAQREQQAAQARDQRAAWEKVLRRFPPGMRVRWTVPGGFRYGEVVSHMLATMAVHVNEGGIDIPFRPEMITPIPWREGDLKRKRSMNIRKTIRHIFGLDLFGVPSPRPSSNERGYRDAPPGGGER